MEHPAYQIFNLTNFPNNVSCLQSKLGLESAATVTFSPPQVVPSHSPPPKHIHVWSLKQCSLSMILIHRCH